MDHEDLLSGDVNSSVHILPVWHNHSHREPRIWEHKVHKGSRRTQRIYFCSMCIRCVLCASWCPLCSKMQEHKTHNLFYKAQQKPTECRGETRRTTENKLRWSSAYTLWSSAYTLWCSAYTLWSSVKLKKPL